MSRFRPTDNDFDHARDLRKHEPRPSDPIADHPVLGKYSEPPHRLSKQITTATEIAVLVKAIPIAAGADLIEQYAATVAAAARLEGVEITSKRVLATIDGAGR